jgi:peptidoglycan/LPS O-acetylase OafA/YrhL
VFAGHVTKMPGMGWLEQHVVFNLAPCGVAVFFVLSGFILTYNYAHSFRGGIHAGNYGRFIWDRLSKIYPLYLFTLLLCIPIQMIGQHRDWNWLALGLQVTLLQCILPIQQLRLTNYFNVPGWSISCEMFFYLLAPVLIWRCLAIKRLSVAVLLAGTVSIIIVMTTGIAANQFPWPARFAPLRVPEFIIGVVTAACYLRAGSCSRTTAGFFVVGGLLLLAAGVGFNYLVPNFLKFGPLFAPGAALLIYGLAAGQGYTTRFLSHRWVVLLGMSSFALYLIHDPIIRIGKGVFQHYGLAASGFWPAFLLGLILFAFTQAVAIGLFKTFELPAQKYLRRLIIKKAPGGNAPIQPINSPAPIPPGPA